MDTLGRDEMIQGSIWTVRGRPSNACSIASTDWTSLSGFNRIVVPQAGQVMLVLAFNHPTVCRI